MHDLDCQVNDVRHFLLLAPNREFLRGYRTRLVIPKFTLGASFKATVDPKAAARKAAMVAKAAAK